MSHKIGRIAAAWICLAAAPGIAAAQPADAAPQKAAVGNAFAEWAARNAVLEDKLRSLEPCDTRVKKTIGDVASANGAWLDDWGKFLETRFAAMDRMRGQLRSAVALHHAELAEAQAEHGPTEQGDANIEVQRSSLAQLPPARIDLRDANHFLDWLQTVENARARDNSQRLTALIGADAEIKKAQPEGPSAPGASRAADAVRAEGELWRAGYEARWVRAQVDCVARTGAAPAPVGRTP